MSIPFDTSFLRKDTVRRARHGMPWRREELARLQDLFSLRASLEEMCDALRRPAAGVLPKLVGLHLLTYDVSSNTYFHTDKGLKLQAQRPESDWWDPVPAPSTPKEKSMNRSGPIVIENQTLVNGVDIKEMSDADIYSLIAAQETAIESLRKIKHQPKRLQDEIAAREAGINALVELVDSRG